MFKRSNVVGVGGKFDIEIYTKDGELKHKEEFKNGWTNVGLTWLMERSFKSAKPSDLTFYIGLVDTGGSLADADTMASHAGWTENINYSEAARPTWGQGDPAEAGGIVTATNATKRSFTIDTNSQSIYGAFLSSGSTKSGSAGTLLCTGALTAEVELNDDDVIKIGYAVNATAT